MAFSGIRSIAINTAMLTAARAVNIATRIVYVILVARLLGPELYALLAYSQSWYLAFLPLAVFGLGNVIVRSIAADPDRAPEFAAQAAAIQFLMTIIAGVSCVVVAWIVAPHTKAPVLISVLVTALIGRSIWAWAQNLYTAFEVTYHVLRQEAFFRVVELMVTVTILLSGGGIILLVTTHGLIWWAQAAYTLFVVRRDLVPLKVAWRPAEWKPLAAMAAPFFVSALAVNWGMQGPIILLGNLEEDIVLIGQFALAMQILFIAATLPRSLATGAQPVVTRAAKRADGKDLIYAHAVLRASFLLGATAGLFGLALGPWLIDLLLGADFSVAGSLLGLTLWCLIPITAANAFSAVILARGHFQVLMIANVAGAIVTTVLLILLVPPLGVHGAVLAAAMGYVTPLLVTSLFTVNRGWANPFAVMIRPTCAVVVALVTYLVLAPLSAWLALPAALTVLAAGSILMHVITSEERAFLMSIWSNRYSWPGKNE